MNLSVDSIFIYGSIMIFIIGFLGVLINRHLIRIILGISIMELGVNLFLVSIGYFNGSSIPIITKFVPELIDKMVDPLPQALVLTSIVIGLGTTALSLVLIDNYHKQNRSLIIDVISEIEGDEE